LKIARAEKVPLLNNNHSTSNSSYLSFSDDYETPPTKNQQKITMTATTKTKTTTTTIQRRQRLQQQ